MVKNEQLGKVYPVLMFRFGVNFKIPAEILAHIAFVPSLRPPLVRYVRRLFLQPRAWEQHCTTHVLAVEGYTQ